MQLSGISQSKMQVAVAPSDKTTPAAPWTKAYCDNLNEIYWYGHDRHVAFADRVIGSDVGYASLDDAKAAVAQLHKFTPGESDLAKMARGVVYIDNGEGAVAAFELDSPLARKTFWGRNIEPAKSYAMSGLTFSSKLSAKVVGVQDFRGAYVADYNNGKPDTRV